jgi:aspartate kinase
MEQPIVSGIAFNRDEAKVTVAGVPDVPGVAAKILAPIGAANIEIDVIVQNVSADNTTDLTFTVHKNDMQKAVAVLEGVAKEIGAREVRSDDKVAKVSIVGVGMRSHAGVASTMFTALAADNIKITTSEIKISVIIDERYLELAVRSLHTAFGLDAEPTESRVRG